MSDTWITKNISKIIPDPVEQAKFINDLKGNKVTKVHAKTDENGTALNYIDNVSASDVTIGKVFIP